MISSLKKEIKVVDIKIAWWVASYIGIPAYLLGIIANWGEWKANILALIGGVFMLARLIDFISKSWDAKRDRELTLRDKELNLEQKIKHIKEEEEE